jgi:hypothetical protein
LGWQSTNVLARSRNRKRAVRHRRDAPRWLAFKTLTLCATPNESFSRRAATAAYRLEAYHEDLSEDCPATLLRHSEPTASAAQRAARRLQRIVSRSVSVPPRHDGGEDTATA